MVKKKKNTIRNWLAQCRRLSVNNVLTLLLTFCSVITAVFSCVAACESAKSSQQACDIAKKQFEREVNDAQPLFKIKFSERYDSVFEKVISQDFDIIIERNPIQESLSSQVFSYYEMIYLTEDGVDTVLIPLRSEFLTYYGRADTLYSGKGDKNIELAVKFFNECIQYREKDENWPLPSLVRLFKIDYIDVYNREHCYYYYNEHRTNEETFIHMEHLSEKIFGYDQFWQCDVNVQKVIDYLKKSNIITQRKYRLSLK